MSVNKCKWCLDGGLNETYHDNEWGIPLRDDKKQFEFISMEVMQCGLNWTLMLKKREIFRTCFDDFDYNKIALYDENKINEIMNEPGMIRSVRKIKAIINNALRFQEIISEFGSFDKFIWSFTNNKTIVYKSHLREGMPSQNGLSDEIYKAMKKRGFKYLGSITMYSHLQACGIINDHEETCWMYSKIVGDYPIEYRD